MASVSLDARFDFSFDEAKAHVIALLDEVAAIHPLKVQWVRATAAQFFTQDLSGVVVLTKTRVHIAVDLPWYLAPVEACVKEDLVEALAERGFQLVP